MAAPMDTDLPFVRGVLRRGGDPAALDRWLDCVEQLHRAGALNAGEVVSLLECPGSGWEHFTRPLMDDVIGWDRPRAIGDAVDLYCKAYQRELITLDRLEALLCGVHDAAQESPALATAMQRLGHDQALRYIEVIMTSASSGPLPRSTLVPLLSGGRSRPAREALALQASRTQSAVLKALLEARLEAARKGFISSQEWQAMLQSPRERGLLACLAQYGNPYKLQLVRNSVAAAHEEAVIDDATASRLMALLDTQRERLPRVEAPRQQQAAAQPTPGGLLNRLRRILGRRH